MPRAAASSVLLVLALTGMTGAPGTALPVVGANDNLASAGRLAGGTLTVTLEARMGSWYPDKDRRATALLVAAFGEPGQAPTIPGPLIRVRSGTTIRVRLVNRLDTLPLIVHGLHTHPVHYRRHGAGCPRRNARDHLPRGRAGHLFLLGIHVR